MDVLSQESVQVFIWQIWSLSLMHLSREIDMQSVFSVLDQQPLPNKGLAPKHCK